MESRGTSSDGLLIKLGNSNTSYHYSRLKNAIENIKIELLIWHVYSFLICSLTLCIIKEKNLSNWGETCNQNFHKYFRDSFKFDMQATCNDKGTC